MSLAQRVYPKNPIYDMFGQRLIEEIRNPQPGTAEPTIILKSQAGSDAGRSRADGHRICAAEGCRIVT